MEQSCDESTVRDEDMEVATIILELPHLIFQSQSRHRFLFTSWFSKRKRSTSSKQKVVVAAASLPKAPSPPPSLQSNVVGSTYETVGPKEKALTSSSPATPLSFSPSESDEKEKPQPPIRKSYVNNLKKRKEQLVEIMEDFTRRNEMLKKDIESKKRFHDQLIAENLELKGKKQKLYHNLPKVEEVCLGTSKSLNLEIELPQNSMETDNSRISYHYHHHHEQQVFHHQPLMMDRTVHKPETSKNCEYPIGGMICWVPGGMSKLLKHDNVGPVGLFDLNVSAEEALFEPDTATKARAAQARFKRKQICRSKNSNATYKARYPL